MSRVRFRIGNITQDNRPPACIARREFVHDTGASVWPSDASWAPSVSGKFELGREFSNDSQTGLMVWPIFRVNPLDDGLNIEDDLPFIANRFDFDAPVAGRWLPSNNETDQTITDDTFGKMVAITTTAPGGSRVPLDGFIIKPPQSNTTLFQVPHTSGTGFENIQQDNPLLLDWIAALRPQVTVRAWSRRTIANNVFKFYTDEWYGTYGMDGTNPIAVCGDYVVLFASRGFAGNGYEHWFGGAREWFARFNVIVSTPTLQWVDAPNGTVLDFSSNVVLDEFGHRIADRVLRLQSREAAALDLEHHRIIVIREAPYPDMVGVWDIAGIAENRSEYILTQQRFL